MSLYKEPFHLNRSLVKPPAVELATSRWYEMVMMSQDLLRRIETYRDVSALHLGTLQWWQWSASYLNDAAATSSLKSQNWHERDLDLQILSFGFTILLLTTPFTAKPAGLDPKIGFRHKSILLFNFFQLQKNLIFTWKRGVKKQIFALKHY
jgi:hypothetical protein